MQLLDDSSVGMYLAVSIVILIVVGGFFVIAATFTTPEPPEEETPFRQTPVPTDQFPDPPGINGSEVTPSIVVQTHLEEVDGSEYTIDGFQDYRNRSAFRYHLRVNESGSAAGSIENYDHPEIADAYSPDGETFYLRDRQNKTRNVTDLYMTQGHKIIDGVLQNATVELASISKMDSGKYKYKYEIKRNSQQTGAMIISEEGRIYSIYGVSEHTESDGRTGITISYTGDVTVSPPNWMTER